jgi:hypothetical protein
VQTKRINILVIGGEKSPPLLYKFEVVKEDDGNAITL